MFKKLAFLVVLILSSSIGWSQSPNLRKQFAQGMNLYNSKKYQDALRVFDGIVRQNPSHEPSLIQLAKTLHKLQKSAEAEKVWSRIKPDNLDVDSSYEYGYDTHSQKKYSQSNVALKRVPPNHNLFDLAQYYMGLNFFQLRSYEEAEQSFDKALVLPDKLSKSRDVYLQQSQILKLEQLKRKIADEKLQPKAGAKPVKESPKVVQKKPEFKKNIFQGKSIFAKNSVEQYDGLIEQPATDHFAKVYGRFSERNEDFSGYVAKNNLIQQGVFDFEEGPLFFFPVPSTNGRNFILGSQFSLFAESSRSKTRESKLIQYEDSDVTRLEETSFDPQNFKGGSLSEMIWGEYPILLNSYVGLGQKFYAYFPEFESADRTSEISVFAHIGTHLYPHLWKYKIQWKRFVAKTGDASIDQFENSVFYHYEFPFRFEVEPEASISTYNYLVEKLDGPSNTVKTQLRLIQRLGAGISLWGTGAYFYDNEYTVYDLGATSIIHFNRHKLYGEFKIKVEPFKWVFLELYQDVEKSNFVHENEELQGVIEKNISDLKTSYGILAGINLLM